MARVASGVALVLALVGCSSALKTAGELRGPIEAFCIAKGDEITQTYKYREDAEWAHSELRAWCDSALTAFDAIDRL